MAVSLNQLPASVRKRLKSAEAHMPVKKKSKHRAERVVIDAIGFDSKAEGLRYQLNLRRIASGELAYQLLQVPFLLPGGVKYVADFMEVSSTGEVRYVDVKGQVTAMFRTKKKQVEALYPVKILCVRCVDYKRSIFEWVEV